MTLTKKSITGLAIMIALLVLFAGCDISIIFWDPDAGPDSPMSLQGAVLPRRLVSFKLPWGRRRPGNGLQRVRHFASLPQPPSSRILDTGSHRYLLS